MTIEELSEKMRREWDERARTNARHYIADSRQDWPEEEFYRLGQQTVADDILTDMYNICQDKNPRDMRVLEIGCGAGRVTRALADVFGEVHAVDVSGEMVRLAGAACRDKPNAYVYQNNGVDLSVLSGGSRFDFAFSMCCFHHIPSREVIGNYVREVGRLLAPGRLFKFEVQGFPDVESSPGDTWLGASFSDEQAVEMARQGGFEARYRVGAGQERFWLWFFKADPG